MRHLSATGDHYFDNCCLPVDVFHFKAKHKESDGYCQQHCNAAHWPDLIDDEGGWRFNSSAAEQANAWIGGFISIVREMLPHRFNFFMDEVIQRRNRSIIDRLARTGKVPWSIPFNR